MSAHSSPNAAVAHASHAPHAPISHATTPCQRHPSLCTANASHHQHDPFNAHTWTSAQLSNCASHFGLRGDQIDPHKVHEKRHWIPFTEACAKDDCTEHPVRTISSPSTYSCPAAASAVEPRAPNIRWLHIPKTGTSFANSIVHVSCGDRIPPWAEMRQKPEWVAAHGGQVGGGLPLWFQFCFPAAVPAQCGLTAETWKKMSDHISIAAAEAATMRTVSFVTIVRRPLTRLLSQYSMWVKDPNSHQPPAASRNVSHLLRFARGIEPSLRGGTQTGCMTKMLAGIACDGRYPTAAETRTAHDRLRRFAFVGVEEQWERSMCVFFRMHGRDVPALALANVRPGAAADRYASQERVLRAAGVADAADEATYAVGVELLDAHAKALLAT